MKKLLTVLAASVGIAAFAAEGDPLSATSFENYSGDFSIEKNDAGAVVSDGRTWAGTKDADGDTNVITAYGEAEPPKNRPDYYKEATLQEAFLKVDSTAGLARYVNAGGDPQGLDKNVYFDMDVQFTVSDSVQEAAEGDKLLVWLYAPDTANAQTNLVVTAATIASNLETTPVNYVVAVPETSVQADTWYRLTVVSTTKEVVSGAAVPHFQVYIDGKQAIPTGTMASDGEISSLPGHDGLFGSLVAYNQEDDTTTTLTSVTFKGTGAVDDLVVTTVKPSFIQEDVLPFAIGDQPYETFAAALTAAKDGDVIKVMANNTSDIGEIGDATIDLNGKTLTFSEATIDVLGDLVFINSASDEATVAGASATFTVEDGTLTIGASADAGAVTMTAVIEAYSSVKVYGSNTKPALSNDGDLKAWSATADADGYYTAVEGGGDSEGRTIDGGAENTVNVTATTVSAAATKFGVSAASVTDAQILAYIVGGTVVNDKAVVPTPTISVNGTTVTVVCSGADSNYKVEYYLDYKTDLTAAEWTLGETPEAATGDDYTATLTDKEATAPQKFYRVRAVVSNLN